MTADTLDITLRNDTSDSDVFVTITGRAMNRNMDPVFISADGKTPFYPPSPNTILQPLEHDVAIPLGGPGSSRIVTVPRIASGRIWFCKGGPLTFMMNPGPAVVEPSMMNPTDPNYFLDWGFAEFTFNDYQLYANISYVDFVSIPCSLELENMDGKKTFVEGFRVNGLDCVCEKLIEQDNKKHTGWSKLIVKTKDGKRNLRALSPNSGCVIFPGLFNGYLEPYIDAVWKCYSKSPLTINTQARWGDVKGSVAKQKNGDYLDLGELGKFCKPSTQDVFNCSTGPFARGAEWNEGKGAAGARLAAALNRGTLLDNCNQPEDEVVGKYYGIERTNHYSRICHEVSVGGKGYAFPYDDVSASEGPDQSGSLWDGSPKMLTIGIGGWKGQ